MTRSTRRAPIAVCAAITLGACATVAPPPPPPPPPIVAVFTAHIGPDTLQIERFERTATTISGRILARAPVTVVRDFTYQYNADGTLARIQWVTRPADLATDSISARTVVTFANDTAVVQSGTGQNPQTQWVPAPAPDIAFAGGLAFSQFEFAAQRMPPGVGDSAVLRMYWPAFLGGTQPLVLRRIATDTVTMTARPMGTVRVAFDSTGRAIEFDGRGSALSYIVQRDDDVAIDSVAQAFAVRDGGRGLGVLSPRDTVRATVHGAQFMVDYGRPTRRGREIFGNVVRWGNVWRLGANQATQFRSDRDVVIGGVTVPAGLYTLWVIPTEGDRWQLIINRETGQWGTMYDPARDLGRVPLTVQRITDPVEQLTISLEPQQVGGMFIIRWDTYEASVPFSPR